MGQRILSDSKVTSTSSELLPAGLFRSGIPVDQGRDLADYSPAQVLRREESHLMRDPHAPSRKSGEGHGSDGPPGAVRDLERETPACRTPGGEYALGTALGDEFRLLHKPGIKAARPPDHERVCTHRISNSTDSLRKVLGQGFDASSNEAGEAE